MAPPRTSTIGTAIRQSDTASHIRETPIRSYAGAVMIWS